jgi:hypothetical protein
MNKHILAAAGLAMAFVGGVGAQAQAQDALIGGLVGGGVGAALGGAIGGSAGAAVAGGIIGGATGALIGNEAERNRRGYYAYRRACYVQVGYNQYRRVHPRNCY